MLFIFHIAKSNKCKILQRRCWVGVKLEGLPHQRGLSHLDLLLQPSQNYSDDYIDIVGFFDDEDESHENFWPSKV